MARTYRVIKTVSLVVAIPLTTALLVAMSRCPGLVLCLHERQHQKNVCHVLPPAFFQLLAPSGRRAFGPRGRSGPKAQFPLLYDDKTY